MFALKHTYRGPTFGSYGPGPGDIHITFRHATREDALTVIRSLMHQLVFVQRAVKYALRAPHGPTTHLTQKDFEANRRRLKLLCTMIATSRGQLVDNWLRRYQHYMAVLMTGERMSYTLEQYKRIELSGQASWILTHTIWDYQYGRLRLTGETGRGYPEAAWWFQTQEAVAHTQYPPDFEYARHGKTPMMFTEAWEALVGLPDPQAREASFRLGARQVDQNGWPQLNPWK